MDRRQFWDIVDNAKDPDNDRASERFFVALRQLPAEDAAQFGHYLNLYAELAQEIPAAYVACAVMNFTATDDALLYFCLWLAARGENVFFDALACPDALAALPKAETAEFEMLAGVARAVLEERGDDADRVFAGHPLSKAQRGEAEAEFAGYDRVWPEDESGMDALALKLAPALAEKYGFAGAASVPPSDPLALKQALLEKIDWLNPGMAANMQTIASMDAADLEAFIKEQEEAARRAPAVPADPEAAERFGRAQKETRLRELAAEAANDPSGYMQIGPFTGGLALVIGPSRKMGFVNKEGTLVVPLLYDELGDFSAGLCSAAKGGKWGFLDKNGGIAVAFVYDEIGRHGFQGGLAAVRQGAFWGAVDKKGAPAVPCLYDDVSIFCEGFASVRKAGKYALIDKSGVLRTDFIYDRGALYLNGRAVFTRDGKQGILDENCREILPPVYTQVESFFEYGYALVINYDRENPGGEPRKMGFIDRQGTVIVPVIYENIFQRDRHPEKNTGLINGEWVPLDMGKFATEKPKGSG
ncbi:MAG: WG repeat-containing protein [Clostridiales Family XIII bacterium]|jgi:hypothetical protein|nr:WG repeat-containing protein [Clostridiales Family XIII bacterium]